MTETHGWTAAGFEKVRDAFQANFDNGSEVGAAFSAYHRGQKVVDLWGGIADQTTDEPWEEDTIMLVFSTTKGMTAICANKLAQEGKLDVEAPVATYWPEFAAEGKHDMPVAYLLSHQAGLAWVDGEMTLDQVYEWDPVIIALQNQKPHWEPGTQHGYHATTYGWLVGEVVKRIAQKSVGTYLHDEIAAPLDLDLWIGLPDAEQARAGRLISMFPPGITVDDLRNPSEDNPIAQLVAQFLGPDTMLGKALFAPGGAFTDWEDFNSPELRAAEIPAAGGVCDARSLARLYSSCVNEVDGIRILTPEQVKAATVQRTSGPNTILMDMDIQFGLGFMLHSSLIALGGTGSFGHFGAGGSVGWADPDAELAFGYIMNRMDMGLAGDLRSFNLINACYDAIA
jgi:CubicO group peptidase (beta-lactamase class C family)